MHPMTLNRLLVAVSFVFLVAILVGCAGGGDIPSYTPPQDDVLREVWSMYKAHLDTKKRPPTKLADLEPWEPAALNGYVALRDGEIVINWGAAGSRVLAYQKQAPDEGGLVLMPDGTVKSMTAAEFKLSPRTN